MGMVPLKSIVPGEVGTSADFELLHAIKTVWSIDTFVENPRKFVSCIVLIHIVSFVSYRQCCIICFGKYFEHAVDNHEDCLSLNKGEPRTGYLPHKAA
jgi:hypothetical protein